MQTLIPRLRLLDDADLAACLLDALAHVDREAGAGALPVEILRLSALAEWVEAIEGVELASWLGSASDGDLALVSALVAAPELAQVRAVFVAAAALRGRASDEEAERVTRSWNDERASHQAALGAALRGMLGPWLDAVELDAETLPEVGVAQAPREGVAVEVLDAGREPRAPIRYGAGVPGERAALDVEVEPLRRDGAAAPGPSPAMIEMQRAAAQKMVAATPEGPLRQIFTEHLERMGKPPETRRESYVVALVEPRAGSLLVTSHTPAARSPLPWALPWDAGRGVKGWPNVPVSVPAIAAEVLATYLLPLPEAPLGEGARYRVRYRRPDRGETTIDVTVERADPEGAVLVASYRRRNVTSSSFSEWTATARVSLSRARLLPGVTAEESAAYAGRYKGENGLFSRGATRVSVRPE